MMVSYIRTRHIPIFQAGELDTYLPELSWVRRGRMHFFIEFCFLFLGQ